MCLRACMYIYIYIASRSAGRSCLCSQKDLIPAASCWGNIIFHTGCHQKCPWCFFYILLRLYYSLRTFSFSHNLTGANNFQKAHPFPIYTYYLYFQLWQTRRAIISYFDSPAGQLKKKKKAGIPEFFSHAWHWSYHLLEMQHSCRCRSHFNLI